MNTLLFFLLSYLILNKNTCLANEYINTSLITNSTYISLKTIIIIIFILSYIIIILEEFINIKKSKITIITATIIWFIVAIIAIQTNECYIINNVIKTNLLEYCELFLFLFVAMIYVNSMKERGIFYKLQNIIVDNKLSLKKIYWITGILSFIISPIIDNLTTALIISSIIITIGNNNKNFINLACINVIVATNAGGAFSPFGDITTLMIWQKNILPFNSFFNIFIPSIISYIIPSIILSFFIENKYLELKNKKLQKLKFGANYIIILFLLTMIISILFQHYLHIPSVIGMMFGFALLQILELISKKKYKHNENEIFYVYKQINNIKWDTLFFFYGIILCIGGLSTIGYLNELSLSLYDNLNTTIYIEYKHTIANILIGLISAVIDNIPIMYAVLTMNPQMSEGQWLLITLTTGTGGSLLSIGSAAGIAIMGQTNNIYTFFSHMKWSWAILIGYISGIAMHLYINKDLFIT